mgnify:CR=1|jgi:hypothetical protein
MKTYLIAGNALESYMLQHRYEIKSSVNALKNYKNWSTIAAESRIGKRSTTIMYIQVNGNSKSPKIGL